MPEVLAVLTGDIVRSTRLGGDALDAAMTHLRGAAEALAGWPGARPVRFTRFRGDGWQCLAPAPHLALRAALVLRAGLRALDADTDSRVAIGIGAGRLPQGTGLAAASGAAFEVSGRGLDAMPRGRRIAIDWADPPPDAALIDALCGLADEISRRWTPPQAEVLTGTLSPGTTPQRALAERHGISQQAIAKRLSAGGDAALHRALGALETGT